MEKRDELINGFLTTIDEMESYNELEIYDLKQKISIFIDNTLNHDKFFKEELNLIEFAPTDLGLMGTPVSEENKHDIWIIGKDKLKALLKNINYKIDNFK